jgi:DNA modification methylase
MSGTGSTLIAALRAGRSSYGIELNPRYSATSRRVIEEERRKLGSAASEVKCEVLCADALHIGDMPIPMAQYVLTSPPYWDMLHVLGAATQKSRRTSKDRDVVYSEDPRDLGNIHDYGSFLQKLVSVYAGLRPFLQKRAYLTIIVKNVKKAGRIYPLAWDLARELGKIYSLKDEKIWCQDNQRLAPFGLGSAWVSNTFHHYCLQFRNDE